VATKTPLDAGSPAASADAARLGTDWHTRIPKRLGELAKAWRAAMAWSGMTDAGGVDLPGEIAGIVALDEVIVHGWDIAAATGRFTCELQSLEATYAFVQSAVRQNPSGSAGLPPVPVPAEAPLVDRLIGLTGRDPTWQSPRPRQ
jgi:uncharacterized protein (TIGR03086 family)